jgi:hypothetical protein
MIQIYASDETPPAAKLITDRILFVPGDLVHEALNAAGYQIPADADVSDVTATFPIQESQYAA